jgi:hypothetical protein
MAMVLTGIGSIVARELGQLALDNSPMLQQVAQSAVVNIAKKSFDYTLENNPNLERFLGSIGIHRFTHHSTFTKRGRHRKISY